MEQLRKDLWRPIDLVIKKPLQEALRKDPQTGKLVNVGVRDGLSRALDRFFLTRSKPGNIIRAFLDRTIGL